jgi:hypothetical protein
MSRLTLIVAFGVVAGCATTGWRAQKIDGSGTSAFERSVVSLQEQLPSRRRAELDTALAVIWMRNSAVGTGDADSDGRVDVDEIRALQTAADDVLTDIRRGVFAGTVQERSPAGAAYVKQLDGLGYEDVVGLAATTSGDVFLSAAKRERDRVRCIDARERNGRSEPPTGFMSRYCGRR